MKNKFKKYIVVAVLSLLAAQAAFAVASSTQKDTTVEFCSDFDKTQIMI